jgi:NitT/TauT family transport system substrate-binding protein
VVAEESPVQAPADLKDQTIGVGTADGAEVGFTRAILAGAGLQEGSGYQFLAVGDGGTAAAAFLNKEVAAYAAAASDAAIIQSRGIALREITPPEYLAFFGNGWAVTRDYLDTNRDVVEAFGRALVKGTRFGVDPANREATLAHAAAANPQEGEDTELAGLLLDAAITRITPQEQFRAQGFGYQPPEHWKLWHEAQVATGALPGPLENFEAAYTNEFVEGWNAQ